jgi:hypothetical protein
LPEKMIPSFVSSSSSQPLSDQRSLLNNEFSISQARVLTSAIKECLLSNRQSRDFNWKTISAIMTKKANPLSPDDCRRLWKFLAYGITASDTDKGNESDENDAFLTPREALQRFNKKKRKLESEVKEGEELDNDDTVLLAKNPRLESLPAKVIVFSGFHFFDFYSFSIFLC